MVDQLNRFASEVTHVAREVGVEGKLGGQAQSADAFAQPDGTSSREYGGTGLGLSISRERCGCSAAR